MHVGIESRVAGRYLTRICRFHPDFHDQNSGVQREMMQYMNKVSPIFIDMLYFANCVCSG